MPTTNRPPLRDSTVLWLAVGGVFGTLSVVPLTVGVSEHSGTASLWENGWFRFGFLMAAFGMLALLWALVLVVAHGYAGTVESQAQELVARRAPAVQSPDAASTTLLNQLLPLLKEGEFLVARGAPPGSWDPPLYGDDLGDWLKRVKVVLKDEPMYLRQFSSDTSVNPHHTSDHERWATIDAAHHFKMLDMIVSSLKGGGTS